jgi:hypothetical protein
VLLADLEDHLREDGYEVGDPPYAWARQQIAAAHARLDRPRGAHAARGAA